VSIAANPAYASLNLASAVQILAYELYGASLARAGATPAPGDGGAPVNASDMQRLLEHLEQVLIEIDFLDPANPRLLMRRLTRLFNRATLDTNEYNIVRGVLTAVQRALAGKS
jgi:tRNA C32,U32 (ribose-2'-O)-methylase TrmJ